MKRWNEDNLCAEQTGWELLHYSSQQAQTKTPLNIWTLCERPACTLQNHEYEYLADSLMHDRPIEKIMHDKIVQCWHILTVCKNKSDENHRTTKES